MNKFVIITAILVIALIGCDEHPKSYWREVCVESHKENGPIMGGCGFKYDMSYSCNPGKLNMPHTVNVCDRWEKRCLGDCDDK